MTLKLRPRYYSPFITPGKQPLRQITQILLNLIKYNFTFHFNLIALLVYIQFIDFMYLRSHLNSQQLTKAQTNFTAANINLHVIRESDTRVRVIIIT